MGNQPMGERNSSARPDSPPSTPSQKRKNRPKVFCFRCKDQLANQLPELEHLGIVFAYCSIRCVALTGLETFIATGRGPCDCGQWFNADDLCPVCDAVYTTEAGKLVFGEDGNGPYTEGR